MKARPQLSGVLRLVFDCAERRGSVSVLNKQTSQAELSDQRSQCPEVGGRRRGSQVERVQGLKSPQEGLRMIQRVKGAEKALKQSGAMVM